MTPLWVPSAYRPSAPAVVTFRDADLSSLFCVSPCMPHGALSAYHARVEGAPQPRHLGRGNSSVYEGPCCPCRRSPVPVPNTPVIIPVLWAGTGGVSLGLAGHQHGSSLREKPCYEGIRGNVVEQHLKPSSFCTPIHKCTCIIHTERRHTLKFLRRDTRHVRSPYRWSLLAGEFPVGGRNGSLSSPFLVLCAHWLPRYLRTCRLPLKPLASAQDLWQQRQQVCYFSLCPCSLHSSTVLIPHPTPPRLLKVGTRLSGNASVGRALGVSKHTLCTCLTLSHTVFVGLRRFSQ